MERDHPLIVRLTSSAPFLPALRLGRGPFGRPGDRRLGRDGAGGFGQDGRMAGQAALQDLARVLREMKTVGDLFGCGAPRVAPAA